MKKNPNTADFWDSLVDKVERISSEDHITKERINFIVSLIPNSNIKLLDIGVGYGFLEKKLKKSNVSIYGIDISFSSTLRAKSLCSGSFVVASTVSIPFKNNLFDFVCIPEVLEHLYDTESASAIREISRVLKDDGRLIISVPLYDEVYPGHPSGHLKVFSPEKLFEEINNSGFTVVKMRYLFAFRTFYFIKNFVNWLLRVKRPNNLVVLARKTTIDDLTGRAFGYSDGIVVARKK